MTDEALLQQWSCAAHAACIGRGPFQGRLERAVGRREILVCDRVLAATDATRTVSWPMGGDYPGAYGTDYLVETSTNPGAWDPVRAGQVPLGATLDHTIPGGVPARFARLTVTGP